GRGFILAGLLVEDDVLFESDLAVLAHLLEPGEAVTVRSEGGDNIRFTIAVDVVGEHLRTAVAGSERERMEFPDGIVRERGGLFPPTGSLHDVGAAVPVQITEPQSVGEALPVAFW